MVYSRENNLHCNTKTCPYILNIVVKRLQWFSLPESKSPCTPFMLIIYYYYTLRTYKIYPYFSLFIFFFYKIKYKIIHNLDVQKNKRN